MYKNWKPYNPQWLIELASTQLHDNQKIIDALSNCVKAKQESRAYIYFVNGENPNQPKSEWQFDKNIILKDKKEGTIVIDVLKNGKIGGIEFLKYLK